MIRLYKRQEINQVIHYLSNFGYLTVLVFRCCCGLFAAGRKKRHRRPLQYIYAYRHWPRRHLNVADLEPSFGTMHSMSGETYPGFDEDGLPVDIHTDYTF